MTSCDFYLIFLCSSPISHSSAFIRHNVFFVPFPSTPSNSSMTSSDFDFSSLYSPMTSCDFCFSSLYSFTASCDFCFSFLYTSTRSCDFCFSFLYSSTRSCDFCFSFLYSSTRLCDFCFSSLYFSTTSCNFIVGLIPHRVVLILFPSTLLRLVVLVSRVTSQCKTKTCLAKVMADEAQQRPADRPDLDPKLT